MALRVDTAAGLNGDPEPSVLWFGARRVEVTAILDRWWGPGMRWWKVETADGPYIVRKGTDAADWELAAVVRE